MKRASPGAIIMLLFSPHNPFGDPELCLRSLGRPPSGHPPPSVRGPPSGYRPPSGFRPPSGYQPPSVFSLITACREDAAQNRGKGFTLLQFLNDLAFSINFAITWHKDPKWRNEIGSPAPKATEAQQLKKKLAKWLEKKTRGWKPE